MLETLLLCLLRLAEGGIPELLERSLEHVASCFGCPRRRCPWEHRSEFAPTSFVPRCPVVPGDVFRGRLCSTHGGFPRSWGIGELRPPSPCIVVSTGPFRGGRCRCRIEVGCGTGHCHGRTPDTCSIFVVPACRVGGRTCPTPRGSGVLEGDRPPPQGPVWCRGHCRCTVLLIGCCLVFGLGPPGDLVGSPLRLPLWTFSWVPAFEELLPAPAGSSSLGVLRWCGRCLGI